MRIDRRSVRLVRWQARVPRAAVVTAASVLCLAGVRSLFAGAAEPPPVRAQQEHVDLGARAVAESFARAYLTWDARYPERHEAAVARFVSSELDAAAGVRLPPQGSQRVEWTVVAGDTASQGGRQVTVQAGTTRGVVGLAVSVVRDRRGFYVVPAYPALVGQVPTGSHSRAPSEDEVDVPGLVAVVRRVVRNFLAGDRADLLADLDARAVVVLPGQRLRLGSVRSVTWSVPRSRVAVVVEAGARGGVELTLRYELEIVRRAGRWLVRSIQHGRPRDEWETVAVAWRRARPDSRGATGTRGGGVGGHE